MLFQDRRTENSLVNAPFRDATAKAMDPPDIEIHVKFFKPISSLQMDAAGLKSYACDFLSKDEFVVYSKVATPGWRTPNLDLVYKKPSGSMAPISPLINSSIDRMAATLKALEMRNMELVETMVHLASVGFGLKRHNRSFVHGYLGVHFDKKHKSTFTH